MKKILSILLCVVLMLSLLAGCGGGGSNDGGNEGTTAAHKHTYATEWSTDETNHWYNATCEHTSLQANLGEHVDENLDAICDICAYVSICASTGTTEHTYAATWSSNETDHWHAASCLHAGAVADKAAHVDEDNDGACDVCAYSGGHKHTYADAWTNDETSHWHDATCGHDVIADKADHVDLTNDGECDICAWTDPNHEHTFADTWTSDVTYHWYGATCEHLGAYTGREQHVDGTDGAENGYCDTCGYLMCQHVDFDLDGNCDICGGPLDPNHVHEFGNDVGHDTTGHWFISTCHPGATSAVESHVDKNNDGQCDVCKFQLCGHSYEATWTNDDTHHWHAITCTCSIGRKDYAAHVDVDGDGGCDVCMYGLPIPSVYEIVVDHEPFILEETGMITFAEFTIYFPQPGRYTITPDNEEVRVWRPDVSGFTNNQSPLTIEVAEAGEMTFAFRYFDLGYAAGNEIFFTYSVVRMDDLVLNTMQGKVELPSNTIYVIKFIAEETGTYKLITGKDGLVIGLTEDSMEYFKGHIELKVTQPGQEFTLYVEFRSPTELSYIFDWRLEEPFCLSVGEGNYAIDVGPTQVDYKVEFTAPADGYYLMQLHSEWLTFAEMRDVYNVPVRMETMEVLTHKMQAGEVFTIWVQTVYNYPESKNCYDTLTITNVGEKMSSTGGTVTPGAEGNRYCIQAGSSKYHRFEITGGELGVIAPNGTVTWTSGVYEVALNINQTYTFMLRGDASVSVKITTVTYETTLQNGDNTITMEPNRLYDIIWMYQEYNEEGEAVDQPVEMDVNSFVSLNWEGNVTVYVNGVEYTRGGTIELAASKVQLMVKSNGAAEVKISVTMVYDANNDIVGETDIKLVVNQYAVAAANRDGKGTGAKATFTAEYGGTYTLTVGEAEAVIYTVDATGGKHQVLVGAGTYTFDIEGGETIEFFVTTQDEYAASISLIVNHND